MNCIFVTAALFLTQFAYLTLTLPTDYNITASTVTSSAHVTYSPPSEELCPRDVIGLHACRLVVNLLPKVSTMFLRYDADRWTKMIPSAMAQLNSKLKNPSTSMSFSEPRSLPIMQQFFYQMDLYRILLGEVKAYDVRGISRIYTNNIPNVLYAIQDLQNILDCFCMIDSWDHSKCLDPASVTKTNVTIRSNDNARQIGGYTSKLLFDYVTVLADACV